MPAKDFILLVVYLLVPLVGVRGLKAISRLHVVIVFLETIHYKNKETAKKNLIITFFTVCWAKFGEMTKFRSKN